MTPKTSEKTSNIIDLGSKNEKKRVKFAFRCVKRGEFYIEPALDPGQKLKIRRKNILTWVKSAIIYGKTQ